MDLRVPPQGAGYDLQGHTFSNFADSLGDGPARQSTRAMHQRDSFKTRIHDFTSRHDAARALVQKRPHRKTFVSTRAGWHAQEVYCHNPHD